MEWENAVKPPYKVMTMSEIANVERNGFDVVSTFSGGGGSTTGYKMAGFNVIWASEFVDSARATYSANHDSHVDSRDIRDVAVDDILSATNKSTGEIDLLDGSPPCASFSTAGRRQKNWSKVKSYSERTQRTDDLFYEFVRLLAGLQPKTFVAENVTGLVKGVAKGYFKEILLALRGAGYVVVARKLNAARLGVPQSRERIIFVGVRRDLVDSHDVTPTHPAPLSYVYTVADVAPHIVQVRYGGRVDNWKDARSHPAPTITQSDATTSPTAYLSGGAWVRVLDDGVLKTRKFSIPELKKICGFPDDYILVGDYAQQFERLGRAVPPVMMSYIAGTIRDQILFKMVRK